MIDPQWLDLDNTIERVVGILDDLRIPYVFTGGVAVITYGDPRTTNDVDLILKILQEENEVAETMIHELSERFHVNLAACREALQHKTLFQAIDKENLFKSIFMFRNCSPNSLNVVSHRNWLRDALCQWSARRIRSFPSCFGSKWEATEVAEMSSEY